MDGQSINTGLTLRGFEVHAITPHHYRHYHTLFLRVPGEFLTESYEQQPGRWNVGFLRPDGKWTCSYVGYKTREEAEKARTTYTGATRGTIGCQFEVWYKEIDEEGNVKPYAFCSANTPGAKAGGTTWETYPAYAPLKFELTEEEALQIIAWRENADAAWFGANPTFLPREEKITDAQVAGLSETAAEFFVDAKEAFGEESIALVSTEAPALTECLECGAVYNQPGHVEWGGMACDRCG